MRKLIIVLSVIFYALSLLIFIAAYNQAAVKRSEVGPVNWTSADQVTAITMRALSDQMPRLKEGP